MNWDTSEKISRPHFPFWGSWSIQVRLILLVLLSVLPALGIILHTGFADKKKDVENAKKNILQTVGNIAGLQETITASTKQMLKNIAQYRDVQNGDMKACNTLFQALLRNSLYHDNIFAARQDGTLFGTGVGTPAFSVADREYFQRAMATREFVAGEYVVSRTNNAPSLDFAFPIINEENHLQGIVAASVRLDTYKRLLLKMEFPEGAIVEIEDRNGIRLCSIFQSNGAEGEGIGQSLPKKIWSIISGPQQSGTFTEEGPDGIRRIYGFLQLRLNAGDKPYLFIRVGIPEKSALSPANTRLDHDLLLFGIASCLALAAAYFLGNLTIVNPIKQLVGISRQMGTGDFNLRSGISHASGGEIGLLARSFDLMASALSARESERLESEESIRQLSEQNQLILNTAGEGIVGLDAQGLVIFINPAAAAMTGYELHDLFGGDLRHYSFPDGTSYPLNLYPIYQTLGLGTASREGDGVLWRKDGTSFLFAYSSSPIIENGNRLGAVITFRDITNQKQMEETLRESERRYREIFNNVSEGLYMLEVTENSRFKFLEQNPAMAQSTGIPPEKIIGKFADEIESAAVGRMTISLCRRCMEEGAILDEEMELEVSTGRRSYSTSFIPLSDSEGKIYRFVCISRDITGHKKLEKELFMARKLEIIGQLAGGVAHEVRNPLNAILSITEALFTVKDIADNPEYQPYIGHIRTQVNRLSKLMTDLLDLGKPIKPATIHSVSLNRLCADTLRLWEVTEAAKEHSVTCVNELDEGDAQVSADAMHLQQALLNLMDNAARCSPAGNGILLNMSQMGGSRVCVKIQDSGAGIPPQKIERIFEPFFTLTKGGTGLGLTLVKHFIESMGGEIRICNNEPPPGCTAELILNAARSQGLENETENTAD